MLEFLKGDADAYKVGWKMCQTYLKEYPKDKPFKRKVKKLKRSSTHYWSYMFSSGIQITNSMKSGSIQYTN